MTRPRKSPYEISNQNFKSILKFLPNDSRSQESDCQEWSMLIFSGDQSYRNSNG